MKIFFSGGGTLGPVTPLIAIFQTLHDKNPDWKFGWVGTRTGPERQMVLGYHLPFFAIASGKLRRYVSLKNVWDIFKIIFGFFESLFLLLKERPDLLISAGGFVSVPLHYAAFLLCIPTWVHQQDVVPGLANELMAPLATQITVALELSKKYFPKHKTHLLGNPVRDLEMVDQSKAKSWFHIPESSATILVLGGGTGSAYINEFVFSFLPEMSPKIHLIHLLGTDRSSVKVEKFSKLPNYHPYQFLQSEINLAYAAADIVIARAGFATLTELSYFNKPAIIIPMPHSHQEENVKFLAEKKAIFCFNQASNHGELVRSLYYLLEHKPIALEMGKALAQVLPVARAVDILDMVQSLKIKRIK